MEQQRAGTGPGSKRWSGRGVVAGLILGLGLSVAAGSIALWRSPFMASRRALVEGWRGAASVPAPDEDRLESIVKAARTYELQGEPGRAEAIYREALARFPASGPLYAAYAEFLVGQRRYAEAYTEYEKALAVGERTAAGEFAAGLAASLAGRHDRAVEHFAAAQALEPASATIALHLGQAQMASGELDAARASLVRSLRLDEDQAVAWGMLAEISLRQNNAAMALQHIRRARLLEPANLAWRLIEARAHRRANDPRSALEVLAGVAESEQRDRAVLRLMAECYGMLSRPSDAAALLARASDAEPEAAWLAVEAAEWFERAGDAVSARRYAARAADLGDARAERLLERLGSGG
jgi:tetratricopeptide (TPR) repeat protein